MSTRKQIEFNRWRAALDEGGFLCDRRKLLVACSGGADSTALACLLAEFAANGMLGDREILLAHVNHGLRGAESDGDERFVRALAERLRLQCLVAHVDVAARAREEGLSIEEAGRESRHDAFRDWARNESIDTVLLAHHREDQQETVLFRLLRGAGFSGLAGMQEWRELDSDHPGVLIWRPLLGWHPGELLDVLDERSQEYRTDPSNFDVSFARNRIRMEILPRLGEVHSGARMGIEKLARRSAEWRRDVEELGRRALDEARRFESDEICGYSVESLLAWPRSVRFTVLSRMLISIDRRLKLDEDSFERFERLLAKGGSGQEDLGASCFADLRYGLIRVTSQRETSQRETSHRETSHRETSHRETSHRETMPRQEIPMAIGDRVTWCGWEVSLKTGRWDGPSSSPFEEWIDISAAGRKSVTVRSRRPGDEFHPLGAPGHKKLKEFFRERRCFPEERDSIPLVVVGGEIAWVVGHRIAEPFKLRERGAEALHLLARRRRE